MYFTQKQTPPRNFPRRVFARKSMDKLALRARYTQALNILDSLGTLNSYGILDSYGTSQPMMTGATVAASHPQLIAPASTSDRGPPVLRSTPPTYVIGSQGRRGILPSAPGRPAAPVAAKNTAIPVKDADGRFPCPHCTKTYLHAQDLKRHLLRHTGERPYKCVLCGNTFSRSDILKRHFKKCSIRRGNPTGASHLSHPISVQDGMNGMPNDQRQLSRSFSVGRVDSPANGDRRGRAEHARL